MNENPSWSIQHPYQSFRVRNIHHESSDEGLPQLRLYRVAPLRKMTRSNTDGPTTCVLAAVVLLDAPPPPTAREVDRGSGEILRGEQRCGRQAPERMAVVHRPGRGIVGIYAGEASSRLVSPMNTWCMTTLPSIDRCIPQERLSDG